MTDDTRRGRGRPDGGRRVTDEISDLSTHGSDWVTVAQLAKYWGRHRNTINTWARKGYIESRWRLGEREVRTASAAKWETRDPDWRNRRAS